MLFVTELSQYQTTSASVRCQQANGDVLALKVLIVTYSQSCLLLQWWIQGRGPDDCPPPPPPLSEGLELPMCYTLRKKITDYEYSGNIS